MWRPRIGKQGGCGSNVGGPLQEGRADGPLDDL